MMLPRFILCVLGLYATIASGYVIKKRSNDGGNRLAEALKVIQRERRRLKDVDEPAYDNYYWDQAPPVRSAYAEPQPSNQYEDDTFLQDLFDHIRGEDTEIPANEEPSAYSEEDTEVEVPAAAPPSEEKVDESELENIFDDEKSATSDEKKQEEDKKDADEKEEREEDKKRTIPWQLGGPGGPKDKPDKKSADKKDDQNDELTEEEVSKLLEDVEETEKEKLEEEEAQEEAEEAADESNGVPVSENEIENALNDESSPGDIAEEDIPDAEVPSGGVEDWEDFPSDQNVGISKEWLLNQYLQQPYSGAAKKKRSQNSEISPEEDELMEEEDEAIVGKMEECLRQFIELEDDENTKLAQALNLATLGQVERTDKYIPDEVEYLKSAVGNEQRIKLLRRCLRLGAEARGEIGSNEVGPARKRGAESMTSQELMEEIPAQTQEADINDMLTEKLKQYLLRTAEGGRPQEPIPSWEEAPISEEDSEDLLLNPYYRELMERFNIQQERKRSGGYDNEDEFDEITPLEEEELEEEEAEAEEPSNEEMEGALENYISQLSPLEQEELKYEVEEALASIPITEAEVCPAIEIYTDDCTYAVQLGLELDEEATDLCNRHQLCYTCGGEFGLRYKDCDKGYLEEADQLCGYDEECKNEAAGLYVVMARGHGFVQQGDTDASCRQQCVLDYIVGPNGNNL